MNKRQAIISDIDNCLAILGSRNPYDPTNCEKDTPNYVLVSVIKTFYPNYQIILCTGRPLSCREQTMSWLEKYKIPCNRIFMRPSYDEKTTTLKLKEQWLLDTILPEYEVILTFEDSYRVADMYRHYDIPCWQVERDPFLDNSFDKMKEKKEFEVTHPLKIPGLTVGEEDSNEEVGFIQRD